MGWSLRIYYGQIDIQGENNIDWSKPTLLVANHPNAFTEPILLATHLKRDLHFVTRSDVFTPRMKWFFKWTHQVPIYRFRDGFSGLRKNAEHLNACANVLESGGRLLIFGEGSTLPFKQVRVIQRGSTRILDLLRKRGVLNAQIVPVSFTYTHQKLWYGQVVIRLNEALPLSEFVDDTRLETDDVLESIRSSLIRHSVHVEDDSIRDLEEKTALLGAVKSGYETLDFMQARAFKLSELSEHSVKTLDKNLANLVNKNHADLGKLAYIVSPSSFGVGKMLVSIPGSLVDYLLRDHKMPPIFIDGLRVGGLSIFLIVALMITILTAIISFKALGVIIGIYFFANLIVYIFKMVKWKKRRLTVLKEFHKISEINI